MQDKLINGRTEYPDDPIEDFNSWMIYIKNLINSIRR